MVRKILYALRPFKFVEVHFVVQDMTYEGECLMATWKEYVFCWRWWWVLQMPVQYCWLMVLFYLFISILIFWLVSINTERGLLKSAIIAVNVSISPFSFCFMYFESVFAVHTHLDRSQDSRTSMLVNFAGFFCFIYPKQDASKTCTLEMPMGIDKNTPKKSLLPFAKRTGKGVA